MNRKIITAFILGLVLSGAIVYASSGFIARDIEYKNSKNENVTNVEEALNDLYNNNNGINEVDLMLASSKFQIPTLSPYGEYTYLSSNTELVTVSDNGIITPVKNGTATVTINYEGKPVLKYNVTIEKDLFTITGGCFYSYNYHAADNNCKNIDYEVTKELLTDGIKSRQGTWAVISLHNYNSGNNYNYMYFSLGKDVNITFSSGKCTYGTCGKTANFYKIENGKEKLYHTFIQQINKEDYETYKFEAGDYVLRAPESWVQFDEWTFSE